MDKTIVLITGCSSGISRALLSHYDRELYRIVATNLPNSANAFDGVPIAQSPRIWIRSVDIINHDKASKIVSETAERWGPIDILIENVGISYRSVVEDMTVEDEHRHMHINYLGPMHLMRERNSGRIINVSSVGGMIPMPTLASYSASNFALKGVREAL